MIKLYKKYLIKGYFMTNRIMQKEIVSDPFTALVPNTDITDTLQ